MFSTSHSRCSLPWWIAKAFAVKWQRMLIVWIYSQELGFFFKSEQRDALELLLRRKDVFCVLPTGFDKSLTYRMFVHAKSSSSSVQRPTVIVLSPGCKRGIGRKHTTFTSCKQPACTNELFSLSIRLCFVGKRFYWANVNFGRLLNIFHTERSWHAYWFSLVGMICPLTQEHFLSWPL